MQKAGKRAADRKLGELENIWKRLVGSHREYCKFSGLGLYSEESKEFIFAKQKMKDEAIQSVETAQGEDDSASDEAKIKWLKKTVSVLQREVGFNLPALVEFSTEALNSEAFKQALEMIDDTENKVRRYVDLGATIEDLMEDVTETDAYAKTVDNAHIQHGTQLSKLRGQIGKRAPEKKEVKPQVNAFQTELMSLDPKRLGSRFMGRFCTTLLDTHSLLYSINEEDWLVSNRTVVELEGKLPREEKLEWARQCNTLPGVTKFEYGSLEE